MKTGIALGSNLGDRAANMAAGFEFLRSLASDGAMLRSSIIESMPIDCTPDSGAFLNAVAEIDYDGSPLQLLTKLQNFEHDMGRPLHRPVNSPRPIDLDILYFGDVKCDSPDLLIPHPRLAHRDFVLRPLAEVRPELVLPGYSETVQALLQNLHKDSSAI